MGGGATMPANMTLFPDMICMLTNYHHSREKTQKGSKGEQPFLHVTHNLDLIYMYTKYLKGYKSY